MLKELKIENLAIIKELDLELKNNLIVLTGETGAGKSIILSAINILIGEKVSKEMIRSDSEYLSAEGVFDVSEDTEEILEESGVELEDKEIIVSRKMDRDGKGKAFINGKRVPVTVLKRSMDTVVDLVGQHTHQMLLNKVHHIRLIDKFLSDTDNKIKIEIAEIYDKYNSINKKLEDLEEEQKQIKDKKQLYDFQLKDIEEVELKLGEDDELEDEYKILFNAGKIKEKLYESINLLRESDRNSLVNISTARSNLENIMNFSKEYEEIYAKLDAIYYELEEVGYNIDNCVSDISTDNYRLTEVVERLDRINELKKKYGITIQEIIDYRDEIKEKLEKLDSEEFEKEELEKMKEKLYEDYIKKSENLTSKRRKIAEKIEYQLVEELKDLNMQGIEFKVVFTDKDKMNKNGKDSIEFMIATNIGETLKPLSKIASGGEVSRIMLALKSIFSKVDNIPMLIFDEIDTGIGGETVRKVAEKLKAIANNIQVLCITHSPQIASKANQQFFIKKKIIDGKTVTTVKELDYEGRVLEISRMLSGENITDSVKQHAIELLKEG